ncbi:hypothetical protein NQZ68_013655 [Dissostichus eleginoides]|nr:hypothetical protein NQZ68_013655 [Dissostichus eleginoides]
MAQKRTPKTHSKKDMQRYRHYGSSSPPVEEINAENEEDEEEEEEEEVYTEEEEPLIGLSEEEEEIQETGSVKEEEVPQTEVEVQPVVQETEGKSAPVDSKNGKRTERGSGGDAAAAAAGGGGGGGGGEGAKYSMFTWFVVLALLGVWSSVAVVYFDVVDYDNVIARAKEFRLNFSEVLQGKLTAYDTDGDGDFDVEDAKVLLGLTKDGDGSPNAESLEEVLDILADEGSDWMYGFFTFLYDVVSSPVEQGMKEEKKEEKEEEEEEGGTTSYDDGEFKQVKLDLQNQ